jgi:plasmid stabilization system protein ParE
MAKEIIWSLTAEAEKNEILHFWLIHNQSPAYSIKLDGLINQAIELLPYYPLMGRKTDFGKVRLIVVENCLIFYEVTGTQILILSIADGRQDPDKIKSRLE